MEAQNEKNRTIYDFEILNRKTKTVLTPKMESTRCSFTLFVAIVAFCTISTVRGDDWSDDELDFTVDKSEARFLNFNNTGLPDAYVSHF